MVVRFIVVVAESDPVARGVAGHWGTSRATGDHVDGAPLRELGAGVLLIRRPGPHIHDDGLDERLPDAIRSDQPTLVFPSIHASESGQRCFTVHPLGNPGPDAEVGGRGGVLSPAAPRLMTDALRRMESSGASIGLSATFEATHHGPALGLPAFFAEIGFGEDPSPPEEAVAALAVLLPELSEDPGDRVALAIGGGHYAPHFTQLALERRWAFGHILSRHSLERLTPEIARDAWEMTRGAEGILAARAADYDADPWRGIAPRLRDGQAPRR